MIKLIMKLLSLVSLFTLVACLSLTEGGEKVTYDPEGNVPDGCSEVSEVDTGTWGAETQDKAIIILRNKAAEEEGNFLVVEEMKQDWNPQGEVAYKGTGKVYSCP